MRACRSIVSVLFAALSLAPAGPAFAQRAPVPVTGRRVDVRLQSGDRVQGELIEASDRMLTILEDTALHPVPLAQVTRIRAQRHGRDGGAILAWLGIGGAAAGLGLSIACSQVEDTECGGVFPGVLLGFGLIGGLFGAGVAHSAWQDLPVPETDLRAYARFPQGAPAGFGDSTGRTPPRFD